MLGETSHYRKPFNGDNLKKRKHNEFDDENTSRSSPGCVLILNSGNKAGEHDIANSLKQIGWQVYDHLYPFRSATKVIRHNLYFKEDFAKFLATQTCDVYHSDKKDYVFNLFLKWCSRRVFDSAPVLILGLYNDHDIIRFRENGAKVVSFNMPNSEHTDFLVLDPFDEQRLNDISTTMIQEFPFVCLGQ